LGYTPRDVAELTLDQICFLLCERKMLEAKPGERVVKMSVHEAASLSRNSVLKGRAADGSPMQATVGGMSLVARLRKQKEEQEERERRQARQLRR